MRELDVHAEASDVPDGSSDDPASIEHELANALAAIVGFSQVIRRDPSLPDDLRRSADLLVEEASRTRRLVGDLLRLVQQRPPAAPATAVGPPIDAARDNAPDIGTGVARPRVLVLDNEASMRIFLAKALEALGYEPVVTALGADAVEHATAGDHAVLLFDHQMPGMSGTDAYETMVATRPDLAARVVLMSGDLLDPGLEAFVATHPVTLLAKPFDLDTLAETIRAVLEATGQSRG